MKKGFTLIELMVVIAVIGILASIALVSLTGVQRSARDAQRKSDISTYRTALERHYANFNYYPGSAAAGDCSLAATTPTACSAAGIFTLGGALVANKYLPAVLNDPSAAAANCNYNGGASATSNCVYKYKANSTGNSGTYVIYTFLEAPSGTNGTYYINSNGASASTNSEPAAP
jgi:prepilin-type N-terminal cleavage/methylation domain-containing protein